MYNGLMKKNTAYQYGCKLTNELNTCVLNTASGGGGNYQTQIVTKLTNGKYPNIPTTNDRFWGGGSKLPIVICAIIN